MELRPATVGDLVWEFAVAESQNDVRHDRRYSQGLGPELFERVRANRREGLTRAERDRLRATVVSTRPVYLTSLLSLELSWNTGRLPTSELAQLRIPRLDIFRPLAPSRALPEFVASLEQGTAPPHLAVAEQYRRVRPAFDPAKMLGAPVLIGTDRAGPFTIVEGMTRLSVLSSKLRNSEAVPAEIRSIVGLGAAASTWPFY